MRHGRKSQAQRFDGFKAAVAIDAESALILMWPMCASGGDGQHLLPAIQRVEEQVVSRSSGPSATARTAPARIGRRTNYADHRLT